MLILILNRIQENHNFLKRIYFLKKIKATEVSASRTVEKGSDSGFFHSDIFLADRAEIRGPAVDFAVMPTRQAARAFGSQTG